MLYEFRPGHNTGGSNQKYLLWKRWWFSWLHYSNHMVQEILLDNQAKLGWPKTADSEVVLQSKFSELRLESIRRFQHLIVERVSSLSYWPLQKYPEFPNCVSYTNKILQNFWLIFCFLNIFPCTLFSSLNFKIPIPLLFKNVQSKIRRSKIFQCFYNNNFVKSMKIETSCPQKCNLITLRVILQKEFIGDFIIEMQFKFFCYRNTLRVILYRNTLRGILQ